MTTAQEVVVTYGVLIIAWGMILGIPSPRPDRRPTMRRAISSRRTSPH